MPHRGYWRQEWFPVHLYPRSGYRNFLSFLCLPGYCTNRTDTNTDCTSTAKLGDPGLFIDDLDCRTSEPHTCSTAGAGLRVYCINASFNPGTARYDHAHLLCNNYLDTGLFLRRFKDPEHAGQIIGI